MVGRTNPAPGGRGIPVGPRSHCPGSLSVSQPLPLPEPVSRRSASQPSAVLTASKRGEAANKQVAASSFFSRVAVFNPSPTLPRRKLALPRGRLLHNGLRDVGVARPSSSCRQPPCRYAPLLLRFSEKFVHFGLAQPGRALLVRARACRCQNSDFEKNLCQNVRHDLETFWRFYASETPIFKKNSRNFFRIGTYLQPKMNIRIGEDVGIFQ